VRILIIDDEAAMHDSYAQSFRPRSDARVGLDAMATELFGSDAAPAPDACAHFELTHALQGLEGVAAVQASLADKAPFAVAFIDVRMPPGIDGKETARRIRALDPDINLVIVTGYSDHAPLDISRAAGPADKIFYIAKPFEVAEVVQTATALCHRWQVDRELAATREALAAQIRLLEDQALELAASESRAVHMANHDSLTEAPNRLAFLRALHASVRAGETFAMAMLDLDRFKLVNDSFGHLAGDELIRAVCQRLGAAAPPSSTVARLGGDEFAVLFAASGEGDAAMTCERLVKACSQTFSLFGHEVQSGASAGVVVVEPGAASDPVDVMRRADLALNEAKREGRGLVRVFTEAMDESIRLRRRIEGGLTRAITAGELKLHYQPIVARDTLEITGFEALLRWESPEYGTMPPALFIPIAEESDLIHDLGDWVLGAALETVKAWPGQYVSVNFSPRQFRRQNFVGQVVERVQRSGVAPNRVQIEITETAIFDDAERAAETLYRLRQMGFRIALDDFGTGYSSLTNIRKFALDCLKVDRSFVDGMARERTSMAIVQSIIHLGRSLGMEVVAEGVETDAQVDTLRAAGCSHLQGYHLARPMPAEDALLLAECRVVRASQPEVVGLGQ
jgi:diguanylate cyclase (GGDEF)-like protein